MIHDARLRVMVWTAATFAIFCVLAASTAYAQEDLYHQGLGQFQQEHYEEALALFQKAEKNNPSPEIQQMLGLAYYHLFQYDKALPLLQQALSSNPDDIESLHALADIYFQSRNFSSALEIIEHIMQKLPDRIRPADYTLAGRIYQASGNLDMAVRFYRKAIAADPSSDASVDLAQLFMEQGNSDAARTIMEAALLAEPDSFNVSRLENIRESLREITRPYTIALGYRYEYDSNAILEPDTPDITSYFDRKSDQRHVLTADLMAHSPVWHGIQAFGEAHLSNNWYYHLSELDEFAQNYILGMGWSSVNYGARLPLEYTKVIVDGSSYVDEYAVSPGAYFRLLSATFYGFMRFSKQDYHDEIETTDEDRDGNTQLLGLMSLVPFYNNQGLFRLVAQGSRVNTDGRNWDRDQAMVYGNLKFDFVSWFGCNAGFQWDRLFFDNMNDIYLVERDDTALTLFAGMVVHPSSDWDFRVQYSYVDWDSNISVYKYYRNVVSVGIAWNY